jgi:hypothetical protein
MGNHQTDSQEALVENRLPQFSDFVTLTYADGNTSVATATRRLICWVPAHSVILACYTRKVTNFNAAGNDYLTVGTYDDDDLLVNDLDISTAAATIPVVTDSTTFPYYTSTEIPIYATYVYSSTAPSTGECEVAIQWVPWHERDLDVTKVG